MEGLILHHYDQSPYAEKARSMLGFKGVAWHSVQQPRIMPKPDLVALTGGYRRIPVLQCGADIYCDTSLIARELDRRCPEPSLFPPHAAALAPFLSEWVDAYLFWQVAPFVTGTWADKLPDAFIEDRAAMTGGGMTRGRMKAAVPHQLSQIRAALPLIAAVLDQSPYVGGDEASYHDFALYHCLWFLARTPAGSDVLNAKSGIAAWMDRIAALGHGERSELSPEAAIEIAREAEPGPVEPRADDPAGLKAGAAVSVKPERFGTERVVGELIAIDPQRIVVAVDSERAGRMHVHFPRAGYVVRPEGRG